MSVKDFLASNVIRVIVTENMSQLKMLAFARYKHNASKLVEVRELIEQLERTLKN